MGEDKGSKGREAGIGEAQQMVPVVMRKVTVRVRVMVTVRRLG